MAADFTHRKYFGTSAIDYKIQKKSQRNPNKIVEKSNKFHREIQKISPENPITFTDKSNVTTMMLKDVLGHFQRGRRLFCNISCSHHPKYFSQDFFHISLHKPEYLIPCFFHISLEAQVFLTRFLSYFTQSRNILSLTSCFLPGSKSFIFTLRHHARCMN